METLAVGEVELEGEEPELRVEVSEASTEGERLGVAVLEGERLLVADLEGVKVTVGD